LCVGSYSTLPLWFAAPLLLFIDGVSFPLHFFRQGKTDLYKHGPLWRSWRV
jgi:hypothetical protein